MHVGQGRKAGEGGGRKDKLLKTECKEWAWREPQEILRRIEARKKRGAGDPYPAGRHGTFKFRQGTISNGEEGVWLSSIFGGGDWQRQRGAEAKKLGGTAGPLARGGPTLKEKSPPMLSDLITAFRLPSTRRPT